VVPSTGRLGHASPIEQPSSPEAIAARFGIQLTGNRIMVVEDETVVAFALCEALAQMDFDVVGPFGSIDDAYDAAKSLDLDAAILDVNLNGKMIYSVADVLRERGLPFVFVTGYGAESIEPRFHDVPVLQKPVEREILNRIFGRGAKAVPAPKAASASWR